MCNISIRNEVEFMFNIKIQVFLIYNLFLYDTENLNFFFFSPRNNNMNIAQECCNICIRTSLKQFPPPFVKKNTTALKNYYLELKNKKYKKEFLFRIKLTLIIYIKINKW